MPHASDASAVWDTWGTDCVGWHLDGTAGSKVRVVEFPAPDINGCQTPNGLELELTLWSPTFFLFTDSCLNKRGEYCTNLACGTHGLPGRILDGAIGICRAMTLGLVHLGSSCYRLVFSLKASAMSGLSTCHDEGSGVAVLWAVFSEVHSSPSEVTDFWERIARCFFFSSKILPLIHRSCAVLLV